MEQILKSEIIAILNKIQRGSAPKLTDNDIVPNFVVISDHKFDLVDSKDGSPVDPMIDEELEQFRGALYDVSARIRRVADSL